MLDGISKCGPYFCELRVNSSQNEAIPKTVPLPTSWRGTLYVHFADSVPAISESIPSPSGTLDDEGDNQGDSELRGAAPTVAASQGDQVAGGPGGPGCPNTKARVSPDVRGGIPSHPNEALEKQIQGEIKRKTITRAEIKLKRAHRDLLSKIYKKEIQTCKAVESQIDS